MTDIANVRQFYYPVNQNLVKWAKKFSELFKRSAIEGSAFDRVKVQPVDFESILKILGNLGVSLVIIKDWQDKPNEKESHSNLSHAALAHCLMKFNLGEMSQWYAQISIQNQWLKIVFSEESGNSEYLIEMQLYLDDILDKAGYVWCILVHEDESSLIGPTVLCIYDEAIKGFEMHPATLLTLYNRYANPSGADTVCLQALGYSFDNQLGHWQHGSYLMRLRMLFETLGLGSGSISDPNFKAEVDAYYDELHLDALQSFVELRDKEANNSSVVRLLYLLPNISVPNLDLSFIVGPKATANYQSSVC